MRHHKANRKLNRTAEQRRALLKSLTVALIKNHKIKTTETKAKELRPYVEKLITHGKKGELASRRLIASKVGVPTAKKIVDNIAPNYKGRDGGYTRIVKLATRKSDGSPMAQIELV